MYILKYIVTYVKAPAKLAIVSHLDVDSFVQAESYEIQRLVDSRHGNLERIHGRLKL
jgi:hypothetical protein